MEHAYSIYSAKAKLSEIIRLVKNNQHVVITERGTKVAEVIPYQPKTETMEARIEALVREGIIIPAKNRSQSIKPITKRPGALKRFLASRE